VLKITIVRMRSWFAWSAFGLLSWVSPLWAAPGVVFALQERTAVDSGGELAAYPALEFVTQIRGEQFRNPPLPSDTDFKFFGENYFKKNNRYFLWRQDEPLGEAKAVLPDKVPSLYGSLEAPLQSEQRLLPLPELALVLATDQPLKVRPRKAPTEETLVVVDSLAQAALAKQGLPDNLVAKTSRVWAAAAVMPGRPEAVVALYRHTFSLRQAGATFKRLVNLLLVAEPVTEKGQTIWQPQLSLASFGNPETSTVYGPLAVVDLNGDGNDDLIVRETRFDRWVYGIYSRHDGKWQPRYTGREGNYSSDIPEPPPAEEEPAP
jgi:hypothetical protein